MKKCYLIILIILLLSLVPSIFLCVKGISYFSQLEGQEVALSYREFANNIKSDSVSNTDIASRVNKMADGEEKIAKGFGALKLSLYFWLIAIIATTSLQAFLIRVLLKTHNKLSQQDAASGAAA